MRRLESATENKACLIAIVLSVIMTFLMLGAPASLESRGYYSATKIETESREAYEASQRAIRQKWEEYDDYLLHRRLWFLFPQEFSEEYKIILSLTVLVAGVDALLYCYFKKINGLSGYICFLEIIIALKMLNTIFAYVHPAYCH